MSMVSEDPVDTDDRRFLSFYIRQCYSFICLSRLVEIEVEFCVGDNDPDMALKDDEIPSGFRDTFQK